MSDYPKSPGGIYMVSEPKPDGPIPQRTEIPVQADKKINWWCFEVRGTDLYPWPEDPEVLKSLEALRPYLTDDRLLTTKDALKPGMKLLVQDLIGWGPGIVQMDEHGNPHVHSPSGKLAYCIDFVNDRPAAADGTPAPPRWVCTGSMNLAGIQRLKLHTEAPPEQSK